MAIRQGGSEMFLIKTADELWTLASTIKSSVPILIKYLNELNPNRIQTGCVVRLALFAPGPGHPKVHSGLTIVDMPFEMAPKCEQYSIEKLERMVRLDHNSSAQSRDPDRGRFAGAIRLKELLHGLAVSGWWEEYDVLHAVWIALKNNLITHEQAAAYLRELDSPTFGSGADAYEHLAARLNDEMPVPGWVSRYFADPANQMPNVWRGGA